MAEEVTPVLIARWARVLSVTSAELTRLRELRDDIDEGYVREPDPLQMGELLGQIENLTDLYHQADSWLARNDPDWLPF